MRSGTERYLRWGKQFREFPELFLNWRGLDPAHATIDKISGKIHPGVQALYEALYGQTISGYKNWDIEDTKGLANILPRLKVLTKAFLPFSTQTLIDHEKSGN